MVGNVHLTKANYGGPQLLRTIKGRDPAKVSTASISPAIPRMKQTRREKSVDTDADPQSSSSDEEQVKTLPSTVTNSSRTTEMNLPSPTSKRKAANSTTNRAKNKKRRLQDEPTYEPLQVVDEKQVKADEFFEALISSSSQSRRKSQKTYGNKWKRTNTDISGSAEGQDEGVEALGFKTYEVPGIPSPSKPAGSSAASLQIKEPIPLSFKLMEKGVKDASPGGMKTTHTAKMKKVLNEDDTSGFYIPPPLENETVSTSTSTRTNLTAFENLISSPTVSRRPRSGSTSSLSSVDSIISFELDSAQKAQLLTGDDGREAILKRTIKCPLCRQVLELASVDYIDPRQLIGLTLKRQQLFCLEHRRKDAHQQWTLRGYPKCDWHDIEKHRVSSHVDELSRILLRKQKSSYLDELDAKVTAARRNPKVLRSYLKEGIVDTVKHGYFGPKGANIMALAITNLLKSEMKQGLDSDTTIAKVGIGTFVSVVLVPELMTRLVMEDMKTKTKQDARDVLVSSADLGLLVNADDDHVERVVDEG